jgi:hypothetical protein
MTWDELRQTRDDIYRAVHLSEGQSRLRKDIAIHLGRTDVQVIVASTGRRGRLVAFNHDGQAVVARPDGLAFREFVDFDGLTEVTA